MKNNSQEKGALRPTVNASNKRGLNDTESEKPQLISEDSSHQEGVMLWNNDETNWDSLCHSISSLSEGSIVNGLANFDQSAYTENAVLVER